MVGIVNNAMQPLPPGQETAPALGQGDAPMDQKSEITEDGEQATEEEQKAYDGVVYTGMDVIHNEETKSKILELMEAGKDQPGETLAQIAVMIISEIDEKSGGKIPEVVIAQSTAEILSIAGELAEEAGIFKFDEGVKNNSVQHMWVKLADLYDISQDDIQELQSGMSEEEVQNIVKEQQGFDIPASNPQVQAGGMA